MKALKWLVICLAVSMFACQPVDEETAEEQNCLTGKTLEDSCDDLYEKALKSWKDCEEQGAENDIMLEALEVIRDLCNYDNSCSDPDMMKECLNGIGFLCSVPTGDMGLTYACADVIGLHE